MEPLEPRPSPPESEFDIEVEIVGDRVPVANVALGASTPVFSRWWDEPRGMPRRFGVGSLMAITVTYALVFSVATALGAQPIMTAALFLLLMTVTAGQVLLFGGKRPRLASVAAGAALCGLGVIVGAGIGLFAGGFVGGYPALLLAQLVKYLLLLILFVPLGALLGYLAGAIVGGTFVVIEMFRRFTRGTTP